MKQTAAYFIGLGFYCSIIVIAFGECKKMDLFYFTMGFTVSMGIEILFRKLKHQS